MATSTLRFSCRPASVSLDVDLTPGITGSNWLYGWDGTLTGPKSATYTASVGNTDLSPSLTVSSTGPFSEFLTANITGKQLHQDINIVFNGAGQVANLTASLKLYSPSLTPVPEPTSILLFGTAAFAFGTLLHRRRKRGKAPDS